MCYLDEILTMSSEEEKIDELTKQVSRTLKGKDLGSS